MNLQRKNIGVIGDPTVGKTSLIQLYISNGNLYPRDYHLTTGAEIFGKIEESDEIDKKIIIHDFSGKEIYYKNIVQPMLKGVKNYLFVYDCTNRKSFMNLKNWISRVKREAGNIEGIVVANKIDFAKKSVESEEGYELAQAEGFEFIEASINDYETIRDVFLKLVGN